MIPTLDYCAEVDEEAEVSFVVKGSDISWPIESVMFTGADGQVYTSEPSDVSRYLQPVNPQHCRSPDQQKKQPFSQNSVIGSHYLKLNII